MSRRHGRPGRCTPRRPKLTAIDRGAIGAIALASALDRGCTCSVELSLRHTSMPGVQSLTVAHDEGCPAIAGGAW